MLALLPRYFKMAAMCAYNVVLDCTCIWADPPSCWWSRWDPHPSGQPASCSAGQLPTIHMVGIIPHHILYVHKTLRHGLIIEVRIFGKCCVAAHHVIAHPYARFLSCSGSSSSWQKYFLLHTPKLRYLLADSAKNSSVSPLFHLFNLI